MFKTPQSFGICDCQVQSIKQHRMRSYWTIEMLLWAKSFNDVMFDLFDVFITLNREILLGIW